MFIHPNRKDHLVFKDHCVVIMFIHLFITLLTLGDVAIILKLILASGIYWWQLLNLNDRKSATQHWFENDLLLSGSKSLPEQMLTKFYDAIAYDGTWPYGQCHWQLFKISITEMSERIDLLI